MCISLYKPVSYLFFTFILEAQTSRSFLEALAIIRPGLVRFELHPGVNLGVR